MSASDLKPHSRYFYPAVIFWIGFAALIYQLCGIRVLFMFFVENTHAVAIAISAFLGGMAFSSLLFSRLAARRRNADIVAVALMVCGLYGYFLLSHYTWIPIWLDELQAMQWNAAVTGVLKYFVMWIYLFIPGFCFGGSFPLINGLYLQSLERSTHDTGTIYFWDTFGAIIGALTAGFILLPLLGVRTTIVAAAVVSLLTAAMVARRSHAYVAVALVLAMVGYETYFHSRNAEVMFRLTESGHIVTTNNFDSRYGTVQFQEESPFGRITVGTVDTTKLLFVNYRVMCDNLGYGSEEEMADLTMEGVPAKSSILNIGLGCGLTASSLAFHPHTGHLDIVEINPVIEKAAHFFAAENKNVLQSPAVALHIQDGAEWLRHTQKKYEAIVIDVEEVSVIYSSPLYTREYFSIMKQRLNPEGILCLWSFTVSPEFTRVLYNTLKSVFPHVIMRHYGKFTTFHTASHPLPVKTNSPEFVAEIMALNNHEINTMNTPALEKYYDSNQRFNLPEYYREEFVRYR